MKKSTGNSTCIDAMLWVGNALGKYQTVDEFLREVKLRGCCRQLPFIPGWMKFGKTKVFLAHRDKQNKPNRGVIFGYFVLHRIEMISDNKVAHNLVNTRKTDSVWPSNTQACVNYVREWQKEKCSREELEIRLTEKLKKDYTRDYARGRTYKEPLVDDDGDDISEILELIEEVANKLVEQWSDRDQGQCFYPDYFRPGEGHRMCSLRKKPGSIYAVDALCASVHDTYRQLLPAYLSAESQKSGKDQSEIMADLQEENELSWQEWRQYRKKHPRWNSQALLKRYQGPFHQAVEEVYSSGRQLKYSIDTRLRGKATNYGELIVFNRPFPILEKAPQAAFQGIWHIDGSKLIDQIAAHAGGKALIPTIYSCNVQIRPNEEPKQITTQKELSTWLAQELNVSQACATRFLSKTSFKAHEQLQHFHKFNLPGIGSIRVRGKEPRKRLKFIPAKAISVHRVSDTSSHEGDG